MAKHTSVNVDPFASTKESKRKGVSFYFDESTIARLHARWLVALAEDPKATKSAIVEAALIAYLSGED